VRPEEDASFLPRPDAADRPALRTCANTVMRSG
jgi:hypothetical protein